MEFSAPGASGREVRLHPLWGSVTAENCQEYVRLAINMRLHEFDEQVTAMREGLSRVVPVPMLSLFTGPEMETMACGSPEISIDLLKSVCSYKNISPSSRLVRWFWQVMESLNQNERTLFLRFVWGRTRLPRSPADFRGRDFVLQVLPGREVGGAVWCVSACKWVCRWMLVRVCVRVHGMQGCVQSTAVATTPLCACRFHCWSKELSMLPQCLL